jgi:tRNA(Arg) A34 adenosine deaminase TadA
MCVATMYLCGIAKMYFAAGPDDSAALMGRLAAKNPSAKRRFSMAQLRAEVGLPSDERQMPMERLGVAEVQALFRAFGEKHG